MVDFTNPTPELIAKIRQAIPEYNRFIVKEEARSAALRPKDIQQVLNFYKAQVAKFTAILEAQ